MIAAAATPSSVIHLHRGFGLNRSGARLKGASSMVEWFRTHSKCKMALTNVGN